jgi:copper transport protein
VDLVVTLPPLAPDTYRLQWSTLSSDDLHATRGVVVFGVQRAVAAAASRPADPAPRLPEIVLRATTLLGGGLAVGGLLLGFLLGRARGAEDDARDAVRARILAMAAGGAFAAVAVLPLLLLVQLAAANGPLLPALGRLLGGSGYGPRWAVHVLAVAALGVIALRVRALLVRSHLVPRWQLASGLLATGVFGISGALLGHTGATASQAPARVAVAGLHLVAGSAWAGALIAAAVAGLPALRRGADPAARRSTLRSVLQAFGPVAVGCVVTVGLTGAVLAGAGVANVDAALSTVYGRALLLKVALVGVAGVLGLRTSLALRRSVRRGDRAVAAEALALAGVLGLAALLSAASPPRGPRYAERPDVPVVSALSGDAADLVETVSVVPNLPGRNFLSIAVADTRRPAPAPVTGVTAVLRSPRGQETSTPVVPTGVPGEFTAPVEAITTGGMWRVRVAVHRRGLPDTVAEYPWGVRSPDTVGVRPDGWRTAPLAPWLDGGAAAGAIAALLAAGVLWRRRGRAVPAQRTPVTPSEPRVLVHGIPL